MSTYPDKICSCCKTPKPASRVFFKPLKAAKDGLSSWCRDCTSTDAKRAYVELKLDPEAFAARALQLRNAHLKRKYGITGEQYDRMFEAQCGLCAICRCEPQSPARGHRPVFYVDHDHATKEVRGLLCHDCNTLLGNAHDRPEILTAAISYLQRSEKKAAS